MKILNKILIKFMETYIEFVYKTSKVHYLGPKEFILNDNNEKFVALFWHGESYCLYPAFKGTKLYIATTKDRRGDYISEMCHYFKYKTLRIPDVSDGGNHIFKICDLVKNKDSSNMVISLDGPLGPYHVLKDFPFILAYLLKRKVIPISIHFKRKIKLKKRWDKFIIPFPFNYIEINIDEPMEINREDKREGFTTIKNNIKVKMESKEKR